VTLFCDTSALVKLVIEEPESEHMLRAANEAEWIAVCRITWAEAVAAMARRAREDPASADAIQQAREQLGLLWPSLLIVEVSQPLVEAAGRFADGFALRGYDSVQLAAAQQLQNTIEQPLTFACFDRRLNQAAELLQLQVLS
jgi:predicted nucleic acid-binding protein